MMINFMGSPSCCDSLWLRTRLFIQIYSSKLSLYLSELYFLPAVACKIQARNRLCRWTFEDASQIYFRIL